MSASTGPVLVVGATSALGEHLVPALLAAGLPVQVVLRAASCRQVPQTRLVRLGVAVVWDPLDLEPLARAARCVLYLALPCVPAWVDAILAGAPGRAYFLSTALPCDGTMANTPHMHEKRALVERLLGTAAFIVCPGLLVPDVPDLESPGRGVHTVLFARFMRGELPDPFVAPLTPMSMLVRWLVRTALGRTSVSPGKVLAACSDAYYDAATDWALLRAGQPLPPREAPLACVPHAFGVTEANLYEAFSKLAKGPHW
jgi:hypothetical protein